MLATEKSSRLIFNVFIAISLIFNYQLKAQEAQKKAEDKPEDIVNFMEDGMKEIDFYSLEELLNVQVDVASLFEEDELVVGSTVSTISPQKWKQLGARRTYEALNNEMGVQATPNVAGTYNIAIRGYSTSESLVGIATLIDGFPVNLITMGTAFGGMPNFELGVLDKIEMIKGPGSAIYGSDAFHGVLSLKTFESDKNYYSAEAAGAYPLYGEANLKISQGFGDNLVRIDAAFSASRQEDQDLKYEYDDKLSVPPVKGTGTREMAYTSKTGVFKVRVNPSDKLKLHFGAYITDFVCDGYPATAIGKFGNTTYNLRDRDISSNDTIYYIGTGSASYTLPNSISVSANGFYGLSNLEYSLYATPSSLVIQKGKINQYGTEITVKQPENSLNLQWLVAYSYKYGILDENSATLDLGISKITQKLPAEGFTRKINSAFTQLKWGAIKERLFILCGGRLDYYEDLGNQISPRGGIIFLPTKKSSIKALYGRAFKAPTQVQLYGFPYIIDGNTNLKPETIDVYELTYILKGDNWKFNITGYYSSWLNAIIGERRPGELAKYYNKGKNDSIGGETNLCLTFNPFAVDLGFSYIKSSAINVQDPEDISQKKTFPYWATPEYSAEAGLHYILKPADINFYLNNRLYLNVRENAYDINPHADKLPTYYRMDLNISKIMNEKLEIYLDIRNLLNRKNYIAAVDGADKGFPEPGISVMLRAGYKL